MQNPQMPNIPGVGAMTDTLDFVKNLWGSMSVPGMSIPGMGAPALSVDDLDKKIADLKAVESWLNVNGAMLRGTIQALEIQRGTIASLKSMGASFAEAMSQPAGEPKADKADTGAGATAPTMPDPALWWNVLQDQFKQAVSSAVSSSEAMTHATTVAQEAAARMAGAPAAAAAAAGEPSNGARPRAGKAKPDKV
jgi:hypothetical protein